MAAENGKIRTYRDLRVWQVGMAIVRKVYEVTKKYPRYEQYGGMAGQSQRAAVSIPSNVAEGFARGHAKEHKQFYNVSVGSTAELGTLVKLINTL